jgi:hypothetical protein
VVCWLLFKMLAAREDGIDSNVSKIAKRGVPQFLVALRESSSSPRSE